MGLASDRYMAAFGDSITCVMITSRAGERPSDNNELDKFRRSLLECRHIVTLGSREEGATPSRSRRCEWGRNP